MPSLAPNRRGLLASAAGLASLPLLRASPALAQAVQLSLGVGLAQEGGALVLRMQQEKLFEQAAQELGLAGVEAEYLSFPVLLRMLQGIAAGQLQVGMLGSTPCIRTLTGPDPAVPIAIAGGGNTFPLQVPPGSPITNLDGLRGKTVLTIVGSDLHLVLVRMCQAHFGTEDLKELGIGLRNMSALTELGRAQAGVDAVLSLEPIAGSAERAGDLVTVLMNNGRTGPAYEGPEGKGAGHTIASFAKTEFAPEAYYPHRIWWVVRQDFLEESPKAVTALLAANARAVEALSKMSPQQVVDVGGANWPGTREAQADWVETVLWKRRGWPWITESDVKSLIGLSATGPIYQARLEPTKAKSIVRLGADAARDAWELTGRSPPRPAFDETVRGDVRGPPVWEMDAWSI